MNIFLASPKLGSVRTGNQCTASDWASIFESLGHEVTFSGKDTSEILVALHAEKSHALIADFRKKYPNRRIVLALTGTDIYPEPNDVARESMKQADALVVLQSRALTQIPEAFREKARVIVQSVRRMIAEPDEKSLDPFVVSVAGHLRDVKDPMRAAEAARLLPSDSKVRVEHAGAIIDPKYEKIVGKEQAENPRYVYLGEKSREGIHQLMQRSQVMVLSSFSEGGARVVGESIVEGTPMFATRIDGVTGLVGSDYPGLFTVGDSEELARLMYRMETSSDFRETLRSEAKRLAPIFDPALERKAWRDLIAELRD